MGTENLKKDIPLPINGWVADLPTNILQDTQWTNVNNIRFAYGFLEKVEGYLPFMENKLPEYARLMDLYYKKDNQFWLLFLTNNGVYYLDGGAFTKVADIIVDITDPISTEVIQDWYIYSSKVNPIYYWDGITEDFSILPGPYNPPYWQASTAYNAGDLIKPSESANVSRVVYIANNAGTSGAVEPVFPASGVISDNNITWEAIGGLDLEGSIEQGMSASTIKSHQGFLVVGNTTEGGNNYPFRVRWSQFGNITRWRNDPDTGFGQAGYIDLDSDVSWIQTIKPLFDALVVYKERAIIVLKYIGGDFTWAVREFVIGNGLLAPEAIIELNEEHIFIGPAAIYSFNLTELKLAGLDINKKFFDILLPSHANRIKSFYYEEVPEVWFAFHSINNPTILNASEQMDIGEDTETDWDKVIADAPFDKALVYNIDTKAWAIRDMDFTAFGFYFIDRNTTIDSVTFPIQAQNYRFDNARQLEFSPINIACGHDGTIYYFGGTSANGADYEGYIESKLFDFGRPELIKRIKRVQVQQSNIGNYNLEVHIGVTNIVDNYPVWYGPYPINLSQNSLPWADMDVSGRFLSVRFSTKNAYEPFKITGYQIQYQERGEI